MTKQVMKLEYQQHRFLVVHDDHLPEMFRFVIYKKWFDLETKSWKRAQVGKCASPFLSMPCPLRPLASAIGM